MTKKTAAPEQPELKAFDPFDAASEDTDAPVNVSRYMKFQDGRQSFRVLSPALVGWEFWADVDGKRKPVRVRQRADVPVMNLKSKDRDDRASRFWAFVVWDFADGGAIKILEITQSTVMALIRDIVSNPKWGNPMEKDYDFEVTRTGEKMLTKYTVMPSPADGPMDDAQDCARSVNLEAFFAGEDPWLDFVDIGEAGSGSADGVPF